MLFHSNHGCERSEELQRRGVSIQARTYADIETGVTERPKPNVINALSALTLIPVIEMVEAMGYAVERTFTEDEDRLLRMFREVPPMFQGSVLAQVEGNVRWWRARQVSASLKGVSIEEELIQARMAELEREQPGPLDERLPPEPSR